MARRKPYTKVLKQHQVRAPHVGGMGDRSFKGFQCLNAECTEFIFVPIESCEDGFLIVCPACGYKIEDGETSQFYQFRVVRLASVRKGTAEILAEGDFEIAHTDYVNEAQEYKYCIICNTLKPLHFFDRHSARNTGRQGECRLCKAAYNEIKNPTRITDQHREAAQKRRLYVELSEEPVKIDSKRIFEGFEGLCFNCGKRLIDENANPLAGEFQIDHTLPASYFWPLTTENATLLCKDCNSAKAGAWPCDFYSYGKLKELAARTGIDFELLAGQPVINPSLIARLQDPAEVDKLLGKYGKYMDELIRLRNRVFQRTGFDFFSRTKHISAKWVKKADELLK